jgi:hypothetical protein
MAPMPSLVTPKTPPPAIKIARVEIPETPAAKTEGTPVRPSTRSLALLVVSAIAMVEAVLIAGQWYLMRPPAVVLPTPGPAVVVEHVAPAPSRSDVGVALPAAASAPEPASAATDQPVAKPSRPTAPRFGGMTFVSPLELEVLEGGKRVGASGAAIAALEGSHSVDLVNDALGFRLHETVTVSPGELVSRTVPVPNGKVSINAVPWAEVWIDGAAAGQTPLANVSVAIGEHQILFRHPQFGERRQTALVKVEGVTRVSANMAQ